MAKIHTFNNGSAEFGQFVLIGSIQNGRWCH